MSPDNPFPDERNPETIQEFLRKLDELLDGLSKKKPHGNNPRKEKEMTDSDNNKFMWFSMKPEDYEFPKNPEPSWEDDAPTKKIAPDLAGFIASASMLLEAAFHTPISTGEGRLTKFFHWIDSAKQVMESGDFTDHDRRFFAEWCNAVAKVIRDAEQQSGLWLTESEDGLLNCMNSGIFNEGGNGSMFDYGGGAD